MTDPSTTTAHWDGAYARGEQALSWYAPSAAVSLRLIIAANVTLSAAVIDIGGGTSRLVDALIERGFEDLSVLDVSDAALVETQRRLAVHATKVHWLAQTSAPGTRTSPTFSGTTAPCSTSRPTTSTETPTWPS